MQPLQLQNTAFAFVVQTNFFPDGYISFIYWRRLFLGQGFHFDFLNETLFLEISKAGTDVSNANYLRRLLTCTDMYLFC